MITPAIFEDTMKSHEDLLKTNFPNKDIQKNAINDVVDVLKQFGYDAGEDAFVKVMEARKDEQR